MDFSSTRCLSYVVSKYILLYVDAAMALSYTLKVIQVIVVWVQTDYITSQWSIKKDMKSRESSLNVRDV